MPTTFDAFMKEIEEETRREGPRAVRETEALKARYALAVELVLLRRRRQLTQRQLSERTGIQQSEISRIEGARANPTAATLAALAHALGGELRIVPARVKERPSVRSSAARSARAPSAARRLVTRTARRPRP
jgi:transcriptional regulator with XRE-family HTH domain